MNRVKLGKTWLPYSKGPSNTVGLVSRPTEQLVKPNEGTEEMSEDE